MEELKRTAEDVVADNQKKRKSTSQIYIRCLVPNKVVGGVIGKGGENIKNLRSICPENSGGCGSNPHNSPKAIIKVKETPDCPHAEERVVHVECGVSDIYAIFSQLIPQIYDGLTKQGYENVKEPELCVLFHGVTMGSIIGKGGKLISDLRSESGAFIKAFPTKLQNCDERVLLIKGEVDKIINALSRIYETVDMDSGPYRQYNPVDGMTFPREPGSGGYQGSVDGYDSGYRGGRNNDRHSGTNSQGQGRHTFAPPPPFRKPTPDFYSSPYKGSTQQNPYTQHQVQPFDFPQTTAPPTMYPQDTSTHVHDSTNHGVGTLLASFIVKYPFTAYQGGDGDNPAVKEVTLENNLTGCVIGDRGSRIKDVRQTSGARIRIGEFDSAGAGERLISIEGSNIQCHLAEYMLQCCVQSFSGHFAQEPRGPPTRKKLQAKPPPAPSSTGYFDTTTTTSAPTWNSAGVEQTDQSTANLGW